MESTQAFSEPEGRWLDTYKLLERPGPLAGEAFEPDTPDAPKLKNYLRAFENSRGDPNCKILVIGAGGLGCELLKDLALSGFRCIDVIDMDTIDISNLNRQFLFRPADVGKAKAEVAARFINERVPGCRVTPHFCRIEDKDDDFYREFNIIICGLDSIEARRYMNSVLVGLVEHGDDGEIDPDTIIPMIDGGTEGFKGQARVILPGITACFECTLELFPPKTTFQICTIAHTPRRPEHCIEYARLFKWGEDKPFKDEKGEAIKPDMDNPLHLRWMYEVARKRAEEFGIKGVTLRSTKGVIKNIIPAIASTNAVIAAACANEAFKFATNASGFLNNYMMYNGGGGVYTFTFEYERKPNCLGCGTVDNVIEWNVNPDQKWEDFIEDLAKDSTLQLTRPSIRCPDKNIGIYMQNPPMLEKKLRPNLSKTIGELIDDGNSLNITAPTLPGVAVTMKIRFTK
jgi:ubiquitin-activating enzyme E1 C